MGLDLCPLGKAKPGQEQTFQTLYNRLLNDDNGFDLSDDERERLLDEWFAITIPAIDTLNPPQVGKDPRADAWLRAQYDKNDDPDKPTYEEIYREYRGYYVFELAEDKDGVSIYTSLAGDQTTFRGQYLDYCTEILSEELINEAWTHHTAVETVDYARRILATIDPIAATHDLTYLKNQREPPQNDDEAEEYDLATQLHIVYSLVRWLNYYGTRGHGFEAYF